MKQIDCIKCRVNMAYKIYGYKKENRILIKENDKLREQIERYRKILGIEEDLEYYDIDDYLNDIFPDEEEL